MLTPKFLPKSQIIRIHQRQIEKFGGMDGIRDEGLLESALAQPCASFGGQLLHATIYEQAAAYLFHLVQNHPFLDGNKRTAFAAMSTFLKINGYRFLLSKDEAYTLVMRVAQGQMKKPEIVEYLQECLQK